MTPVQLDQTNRVSQPGVHDATVVEIAYKYRGTLTFGLRGADNQLRLFAISNLKKIGFNNVIDGTIVSDIYCWSRLKSYGLDDIPIEAWKSLFAGYIGEEGLENLVSSTLAKYGECSLVFVESSYGGSIAAIGDELHFSEDK